MNFNRKAMIIKRKLSIFAGNAAFNDQASHPCKLG
jgi:hypothetical protein